MWEMGGYGNYIWPSYALVLGGLSWLMIKSIKRAKSVKTQLKNSLLEK